MPPPQEIIELAERFEQYNAKYTAPSYNETQVRREFIDLFFKTLGWNVDNTKGHDGRYKDVIHEDAKGRGIEDYGQLKEKDVYKSLIEIVGKGHISRHSNLFNKECTSLHSALLANIDWNVYILPLFRQSLINIFLHTDICFIEDGTIMNDRNDQSFNKCTLDNLPLFKCAHLP